MKKYFATSAVLVLGIFFADSVFAQERKYSGVIPDPNHNPPLVFEVSNTPLTIQDDVFLLYGNQIGAVQKMVNVVKLEINEEDATFITSNFDVTVKVDIVRTPVNGGTPVTETDVPLHLSYKLGMGQQSDAASYYVKDDGGKILSVTIKEITKDVTWDVTKFLILKAEIHSLYDAPFSCSSIVSAITDEVPEGNGPFDERKVEWDMPSGSLPTDFDLEWAWVEAAAEAEYKDENGNWVSEKIFSGNATRITVPYTTMSYRIPLFYDGAGKIFYRVRPVQRRTDGQLVNGVWKDGFTEGAGMFSLANGHEETLNWQVSTTYAEEGKRKTVIQYFDGSLRGRQTVTKDNSNPNDPNTVVAETFYDYQGRPAIQVLPVPTLKTAISFTKNFNNNNIDHEGYPKYLYDMLGAGQSVCANGAPALEREVKMVGNEQITGAGNYYSALNPKANDGFSKFIPEANGYPFTETRYTQDATGRVASQGGVGEVFRIGSGHETKYFYSAPDQVELDVLFGTDAGIASHYQKNMVIDANGQISVSYVDMHGRTVATALAGDNPVSSSLETLPSLTEQKNATMPGLEKEMITDETNVVQGRSIVMVKDLLVTTAGEYNFKYKLDPLKLGLESCTQGVTICYDCLYNLIIRVTDNCGNNDIIDPIVLSNITIPNPGFCDTDPQTLVIEKDFPVYFPNAGSYTITKTLTLNSEAQDAYREHALQMGNLRCKTDQEIKNEIADVMLDQNENCEVTCTSCNDALAGGLTAFRTNFMQKYGYSETEMVAYEDAVKAAYDQARADCDAICENGSDRVNNYRDIMLMDMMPDRGQYARIMSDENDPDGNELTPIDITNREYNIFKSRMIKVGNEQEVAAMPYKKPLNSAGTAFDTYRDDNNQVDANAQAHLSKWDKKDFTDNFQESWANQLLPYHPEFKKLQLIESPAIREVYRWQEQLQSKETWAEVLTIAAGLPGSDPFYSNVLTGDLKSAFLEQMNNKGVRIRIDEHWSFIPPPPHLVQDYLYYGFWKFAIASLKCKDLPENEQLACIGNCTNQIGQFPAEISCDADKNTVWKIFSALYFSEREKFIYKYLQEKAPVSESLFDNQSDGAYPRKYIPRFINPETGMQNNIHTSLQDAFNEANNPYATGSSIGNAATNALNAQYDANCRSYAVQWLEKLKVFDECNNGAINPQHYETLIEQLVAICKGGSDLNHPLGSSNVAPGVSLYPSSFEQALTNFMAAHSLSNNEKCNPYIIDWPKPYENQPSLADDEVWETKPETCVCERVNSLNSAYIAANTANPGKYANLRDYLKKVHGTEISQADLDELLLQCGPNPPVSNCRFRTTPIKLPPALQCAAAVNTCISCTEYTNLRSEFFTKFTNIPSTVSVPVLSPDDDEELSWNITFAAFINYRTGFAKQWHEYARFEKTCQYDNEPINTPNGICARLTNYIQYFNDNFSAIDDGINDCYTQFTNYFNQQEHINLTYEEIKYLYNKCRGVTNLHDCIDLPVYCNMPPVTEQVLNNYEAYIVKLDANGYSGTCSGSSTSDLSVDATAYTTSVSDIAYIDTVAIVQPVLSVTAMNISPDVNADCLDGTAFFRKTAGGNNNETIFHTAVSSDNGYVMTGQTDSYGNGGNDGLLIKFNQDGSLAWAKAVGGSGNDVLYRIKRTADNGFIACGQTKSFGNTAGDAWLVKTDATGNIEWSKKYGDGNAYGNIAIDVIQLADGGFALCGSYKYAPYYAQSFVVRTDNMGNKIWSKNYGINGNSDVANGLVEDGSNIVVIGYYQGTGGSSLDRAGRIGISGDTLGIVQGTGGSFYDGYMMKLSTANGNLQWKQGYDAENRSTWFSKIDLTNDGYQVYSNVTDDYMATNLQQNIWNIYTNGSVHNVRKLVIPGTTSTSYGWQSVSDGGFVAANGENNGSADVIYTKVSAGGVIEWSNRITNEGNQQINTLIAAPGTGYAAAGISNAIGIAVPPATCGTPFPTHLCGLNLPISQELELEEDDPCDDVYDLINNSYIEALHLYLEKIKDNFDKAYNEKCLNVKGMESFTVQKTEGDYEYHYTLYYYDQAGNLVQTVPPAGVEDFNNNAATRSQFLAAVKAARANNTAERPEHTLITSYRYNTLGQVVQQKSPDGGLSKFWYDELGRLVVSQNQKQATSNDYSYTIYDGLGRITQVGQKQTTATIDQAIARSPILLSNWLNNTGSLKEQITRTVYDVPYRNESTGEPILAANLLVQRNLRNRVSYTQVVPVEPQNFTDPDAWAGQQSAASYYTYDIHGNVDELVQEYNQGPMLEVNGGANRYKKLAYTYDLISGKVNTVTYQPDYISAGGELTHHPDRFYHRYDYDAENKLTAAETSHDGIIWETDARYYYYKHGPLARTELGHQQVQGIDYAYTLPGWLKGVNSTAISAAPSEDCAPGTARDVLDINNRQQYGHPNNYIARRELNFNPEFESDMPDDYTAYPDINLQPCVPVIAPTPYITGDMGRDGDPLAVNELPAPVARDAYSFSLNYYTTGTVNDYQAINSTLQPFAVAGMFNVPDSDPEPHYKAKPLFNGNIASMFVNIPQLDDAHLYAYQYDQLNRIVSMDAVKGFDAASNNWGSTGPVPTANYKERISYDPNGNILTYLRNGSTTQPAWGGNGGQQQMDQLTYSYNTDVNGKLVNNRLRHVKDAIDDAYYVEDIDNQPDDNYGYDPIGNLIKDEKEGIADIEWTVYGKIAAIYKRNDIGQIVYKAIEYRYDASGNRIQKTVYPPDRGVATNTIYVRDASGNVMAVYEKNTAAAGGPDLTQTEAHLYGSSRLGIMKLNRNVENPVTNTTGVYSFVRGNKQYELSNHLGNVLVVITDRKLQVAATGQPTLVSYYTADVVNATDYYPFGMGMPGRSYSSDGYRYGFNGKEKDKDMNSLTAYDYGFRIYNPALGRFLSVDPLTKDYPSWSPYPFAMNRPIDGVDLDGAEWKSFLKIIYKYLVEPTAQKPDNAKNITQQHIFQTAELSYKALKYMMDNKIPVSEWGGWPSWRSDEFHVAMAIVTFISISNLKSDKVIHDVEKWSSALMYDISYLGAMTGGEQSMKLVHDILYLPGAGIDDKINAIRGLARQRERNWEGISQVGLTFGSILLTYGGGTPNIKNLRVSRINSATQSKIVAAEGKFSSFKNLDDLAEKFQGKNLSNATDDLLNSGWTKLEGNWGSKTVFEKKMGQTKYYATWESANLEHSTNNLPTSYWKITKDRVSPTSGSGNIRRVSDAANFQE